MKTLFKAIVGSQAYGTSTPESDQDYKGVYIQDPDEILGFGYVEQVNVSKDECYYEIKRFLELLQSANPTVLELLYSPESCKMVWTDQFDLLIKHRDEFLTKKCRDSFGGYAVAQIVKAKGLDKKMNWEKARVERKTVLDFCYVMHPESEFNSLPLRNWLKQEGKCQEYFGLSKIQHFRDCYNMFYDFLSEVKSDNPKFAGKSFGYNGIVRDEETSNDVCVSNIEKYCIRDTILYFNKDGYSMHCKDYKEYQEWLANRNTNRFVDVEGHGQKIDGKNLLHCRRLLDVAMEIAEGKGIQVRRPNADYLLKIRRGEVPLDDIIAQAELDIKKLDKIYEECTLPDKVDPEFVNWLLLKIRKYHE
jgi:predicted nucleotidyltransferase